MKANFKTEMTVPADLQFLSLVRSYVKELATMAELESKDGDALVLATDEACSNAIEHAFDPGEMGTVTIAAEMSLAALTVSVIDRGLPFDASLAPEYERPRDVDPTKADTRGLGLYLIRRSVDEFHWINHGREGKELRLVKHRPAEHPATRLTGVDLTPYQEDGEEAQEQTYTVRRLTPADSIGVAQCIYRTYGYSYPNDDMYDPERITHLNRTGELVSIVGLDQNGQVVGHCAIERPGLAPVAEIGQAVVIPAHRGRSVLAQIQALLEREAIKLGLVGVYSSPATMHVFSQKASEKGGLKLSGISLGAVHAGRFYKGMEERPSKGRKSLLTYFRYLKPPKPTVVHAPAHHRATLEKIYKNIGSPAVFETPTPPSENEGRLSYAFNRTAMAGTIRVAKIGRDTAARVRQAFADLVELATIEVAYLELPLDQPGVDEVCVSAEAVGFFFAGVLPGLAPDGGDLLRLQFLTPKTELTDINVFNPFGRELLDYAMAERDRVRSQAH